MKTLLLTLALVATVAVTVNAHATSLVGLRDFRTKTTGVKPDISTEEVKALWASDKPACIKDGGKVLAVNKAFQSANLGFRDCSSGEKTIAKHRKLGITVYVIAAYQLPASMLKK
jgi:hypothetical protein